MQDRKSNQSSWQARAWGIDVPENEAYPFLARVEGFTAPLAQGCSISAMLLTTTGHECTTKQSLSIFFFFHQIVQPLNV